MLMPTNHTDGIAAHIETGKRLLEEREESIARMKQCRFDTISVHGLYTMQEALSANQGSIIEPLYLSTSQGYADADQMEAALSYQIPTWCYARIANPTTYYLEWALALLEGYGGDFETSAMVTSSGMSAIMSAIDPFLVKRTQDPSEQMNFVASCHVYGGTFQQFQVRRNDERGHSVRWVKEITEIDEWASLIDDETRFLYAELPSNPGLKLCDIEQLANLAHSHGIPLIVDATVATPALMRPLQQGADIVVHSLSKTICSSGMGIGGALISRKGIVTNVENDNGMREDFASYVKFLPGRDNGPSMSPFQALMTLNDLRTLRSKVDTMSRTSQTVAEFLEAHPRVESVNYLGLPSNPSHHIAKRSMHLVDSDLEYGVPVNRYGHLMSFTVEGGGDGAKSVLDSFEMIFRATDLGRIKSVATIPAISTHQQQGEAARLMAGVPDNMLRLSIGGEHPEDIIKDLERGLDSI